MHAKYVSSVRLITSLLVFFLGKVTLPRKSHALPNMTTFFHLSGNVATPSKCVLRFNLIQLKEPLSRVGGGGGVISLDVGGGHWGTLNTAKNIAEHRITARKVDGTPWPARDHTF